MKYGMVIDLSKCSGCMSCDVACKRENFTPPGVHWSKVHIYETGTFPNSKLRALPTHCMHCEEPACLQACPTGATAKRADGVVFIDPERCVGCGYCAMACPYEARVLNRETPRPYHPSYDFTPFEKIGYFQRLGVVEHGKGVIEKCTFCLHRLEQGGQPACVDTCPAGARVFGDLDDPDSEVVRLLTAKKATARLEELGTKPKVLYVSLEEHLGR
jgi:molybdopterin-containing oxidoreductase family iron-sulfur binding subunit